VSKPAGIEREVAKTQPASQTRPASGPAATTPASQPASEIVLVRIGDRATITQADFEAAIRGTPPEQYMRHARGVMTYLVHRRLFDLYVEDHNLITDEELDARIERNMKIANIKTIEVYKKNLQMKGISYEAYRRKLRSKMAEAAMGHQGEVLGKDEAALRAIFEARREEFDGTKVKARHIMLLVAPYETPEQREAKRKRLLQMRSDIESGKRTWDECVAKSDSWMRQGDLSEFTRHLVKNEFLAAAAFQLKVGQLSDIVETPLGYHIIQVTERIPGTRTFEESKRDMRRWLGREAYVNAIDEVTRKYPVVGVQPPRKPPEPAPSKKPRPQMPRLHVPRKPATRSATAPAKKPATRPAHLRPSKKPRRHVPRRLPRKPATRATTAPAH